MCWPRSTESGNDRLLVGFNRRYAPLLVRGPGSGSGRRMQPATVRYLVNAGPLEHGSWYGRTDTEGSRFVGEGGHFVDTVSWLLGCRSGVGVRLRHPGPRRPAGQPALRRTAPPP